MTVRDIRLFGDPVLRSVCDPVGGSGPGLEALVADLLETVQVPGRAGVAANQIGVGLRAFAYNVEGRVGYLLDPEVVEVRGDPVEFDEGCLSVPGFFFPRLRYPFARVSGVDLDGNPVELSGEGLMAQALQHETDHLDGILFIDRLERSERKLALKAIREAEWNGAQPVVKVSPHATFGRAL